MLAYCTFSCSSDVRSIRGLTHSLQISQYRLSRYVSHISLILKLLALPALYMFACISDALCYYAPLEVKAAALVCIESVYPSSIYDLTQRLATLTAIHSR
jgi:hypothetical protein